MKSQDIATISLEIPFQHPYAPKISKMNSRYSNCPGTLPVPKTKLQSLDTFLVMPET
jgi:hypothetical protein